MTSSGVPVTRVVVNARLELLRYLATIRDYVRDSRASADPVRRKLGEQLPECVSLSAMMEDMRNSFEDVTLAIRESAAIGHVTAVFPGYRRFTTTDGTGLVHGFHDSDTYCTITDDGYQWIRVHDLTGELEQEAIV